MSKGAVAARKTEYVAKDPTVKEEFHGRENDAAGPSLSFVATPLPTLRGPQPLSSPAR